MHATCDTIRFTARHCRSTAEAIREAAAGGMVAVLLNDRPLVLSREAAQELDEAGLEFAFVGFCRQTGRILQRPRNGVRG